MSDNTKNFNKNEFKAKVGWLGVIGLAIGLVGVLSILLSLFLPMSKGKDPADYYAAYYTCDDYLYCSFEFEKGVCHYSESDGTHVNKADYKYDFVSAEYAQSVVPDAKYKDRNAILVYQDNNKKSAITLWVVNAEKNNYTFEIDANGAILTTKYVSMSDYCGDTKNYYGRYESGANYLELNVDKTAKFYYGGKTQNLKYLFVNDAWLKKNYEQNGYNSSILLYNDNDNNVYLFGIASNGSLKIKNLTFNRASVIEPPTGTDDNTPSGGNQGGNTGNTPSGGNQESDNYELEYGNTPLASGYFVTGVTGNPKHITVPATYKNEPVVYIYDDAFNGCNNLESVTLSDNIIMIGTSAFENCNKLNNLIIPKNVQIIYDNAFKGCTGLTSVEFKKTDGWNVGDANDDNATPIALPSSDLKNPYKASTYLTQTYLSYMWVLI